MKQQNNKKHKQSSLSEIKKIAFLSIRERWVYAIIGLAVFLAALFIFEGWNESTFIISSVSLIMIMIVILLTGKVLYRDAFIIIVCFGVFFSILTPILDVPDETAHLSRAMYLAQGKFVVSQKDSELLISEDYDLLYKQLQKTLLENDLNVQDSNIQKVESDGLKATNA